jgi:ADP-heptose:LPS heptosyltransferase
MHVSWILGVNTAAIFGPTNSALQGPRSANSLVIKNENLDCLGCNLTKIEECPNSHRCMKELDAGLVSEKVRELINKKIQ